MEPEKSVKTFGSDLLSEETAVDLIVDSISNLHLKDSEQVRFETGVSIFL